jgi:hypothetical protein
MTCVERDDDGNCISYLPVDDILGHVEAEMFGDVEVEVLGLEVRPTAAQRVATVGGVALVMGVLAVGLGMFAKAMETR